MRMSFGLVALLSAGAGACTNRDDAASSSSPSAATLAVSWPGPASVRDRPEIGANCEGPTSARVLARGAGQTLLWTGLQRVDRVTDTGVALDPDGIALPELSPDVPAAAYGDGSYLLLSRSAAYLVDASDGSLTTVAIPESWRGWQPRAAAFDGTRFVLGTSNPATRSVELLHVDTEGAVSEPFPVATTPALAGGVVSLALAAQAGEVAVAWVDQAHHPIWLTRLRANGTADVQATVVADPRFATQVMIAAGDGRYLVSWVADSAGYARRVTSGTSLAIDAQSFSLDMSTLQWTRRDGNDFLVAGSSSSFFLNPEFVKVARIPGAGSASTTSSLAAVGPATAFPPEPQGQVVDLLPYAVARPDASLVLAARVLDGTFEGTRVPLFLAPRTCQTAAQAAFDGENYLLSWEEPSSDPTVNTRPLFGARVTQSGALLDTDGILITPALPAPHTLVGTPSGFSAVWLESSPQTYWTHTLKAVRLSTAGAVLDATPISIQFDQLVLTDAVYRPELRIASDGDDFLVVTNTADQLTGFLFHPADGTYDGPLNLGTCDLEYCDAMMCDELTCVSDVAYTGTSYLSVWRIDADPAPMNPDPPTSWLYARSIARDGTPGPVVQLDASPAKGAPVRVIGGAGEALVWSPPVGLRVDPSGERIATVTLPFAVDAGVHDGQRYLLANGARGTWFDAERGVLCDAYDLSATSGFVLGGVAAASAKQSFATYGAYDPAARNRRVASVFTRYDCDGEGGQGGASGGLGGDAGAGGSSAFQGGAGGDAGSPAQAGSASGGLSASGSGGKGGDDSGGTGAQAAGASGAADGGSAGGTAEGASGTADGGSPAGGTADGGSAGGPAEGGSSPRGGANGMDPSGDGDCGCRAPGTGKRHPGWLAALALLIGAGVRRRRVSLGERGHRW